MVTLVLVYIHHHARIRFWLMSHRSYREPITETKIQCHALITQTTPLGTKLLSWILVKKGPEIHY